jgi:hypothetical protein
VADLLLSHHLSFPRRPLARRAAFVAVMDLFFDLIAELGVGVLFFRRHGQGEEDVVDLSIESRCSNVQWINGSTRTQA